MAHPVQRPRNVQEIVQDAQHFDHKTQYPLRIALRTAQNILHQAANCIGNGNVQDAYLFLYRHAEFCMSHIASHPDRKLPEYKALVARSTKEVQTSLQKLEELKPEVIRRYERYQESLRRIDTSRRKERKERATAAGTIPHDTSEPSNLVHARTGASRLISAGQHSDIALKLADRELRRRGIGSRASVDKRQEQREFDELAQNIRNLSRQLDRSEDVVAPKTHDAGTNIAYPGVDGHYAHMVDIAAAENTLQVLPPLRPAKTPMLQSAAPMLPPKSSVSTAAQAHSLEPSDYVFESVAKTEAGFPLRSLFIPTELRPRFLSIASVNTENKLETCGILCGSLISNALFISHLVIPEHISTSDTCDTTEEGDNALFDYVDGQELMVCGWIHTHPTQTCFLSSRDLHTSVGYQVMLPESVAIVCAPSRSPDYGIFRLTDPPGKQAILNCSKTGLFHPHEQTNLYTDAVSPGHVRELKGLQFQVVDLRRG